MDEADRGRLSGAAAAQALPIGWPSLPVCVSLAQIIHPAASTAMQNAASGSHRNDVIHSIVSSELSGRVTTHSSLETATDHSCTSHVNVDKLPH